MHSGSSAGTRTEKGQLFCIFQIGWTSDENNDRVGHWKKKDFRKLVVQTDVQLHMTDGEKD